MAKLSVQLWSIKNEIGGDFKGALRALADAGYDGVEFCGDATFYGNLSAKELKAFLDSLGLVSSGAHVGYTMLRDQSDEVIAYHKVLGTKYIICPGPTREYGLEKDGWEKMNSEMRAWNKKLTENGFVLGWHNHGYEFETFDGRYAFDIVLDGDASMVYELDTYWSEFANVDTLTYMDKIAGRCPLVHLKDMKIDADGEKSSTVYGEGILNNRAIVDKALANKAEWLVIEWEAYDQNGVDAVVKCAKNLKALLA